MKRAIVVVDGRGTPKARGRFRNRCGSARDGRQCAYADGHDGYHCDQNGLTTLEDAEAVRKAGKGGERT